MAGHRAADDEPDGAVDPAVPLHVPTRYRGDTVTRLVGLHRGRMATVTSGRQAVGMAWTWTSPGSCPDCARHGGRCGPDSRRVLGAPASAQRTRKHHADPGDARHLRACAVLRRGRDYRPHSAWFGARRVSGSATLTRTVGRGQRACLAWVLREYRPPEDRTRPHGVHRSHGLLGATMRRLTTGASANGGGRI